jgi:hypothetical protein
VIAQPVWKLSVDLETKTAAFQTGMADAAKSARKSFTEIEHGAAGMSESTRMSMTDAREGVMLLGEQFGVRLPRALTTFLAELGPVAGAIDAAFPFIAVAAFAGILIEQLVKIHEAGIKLTEDQIKFGTAAEGAFNDLDKKLLQAGITADDLSNNHLDAVQKKLQLIDMQSMDELNHTFGILQKAADAVFKDLDSHWYTLGKGSTGAKNALDQFQTKYESLLATGKGKDASDLLSGTLQSAKQSLQSMESAQAVSDKLLAQANVIQRAAMLPGLKEQEIARKDALTSQRLLVQSLEDQVTAQGKVSSLTTLDKKNVVHADHNAQSAKKAAAAKEGVATQQSIAEQGLAGERATADASMTIHHATIEARLASDIAFAGKDKDIKEAANAADIAALDKSGKDYASQLKALQDNALKITAEYNAKVTELKSKATVSEYNRDIQALERAEAQKIDATKEGSAARLAAIDSAIKEEEAKGLQSTEHFQELLRQRGNAATKEADEEAKAAADAASSQAKATAAMAAENTRHQNKKTAIKQGDGGGDNAKQIALEKLQEQQSYADKAEALQKELDLYKKAGADRVNQARDVQNQLALLEQEHKDKVAELSQQESKAIKQSYADMGLAASQSLLQIAEGHQSLAATVQKYAQQGLEHVLEALFAEMAGNKTAQMSAASAAAAKAGGAVSGVPIVGPVLAPVAAASVFAALMAFEGGGVVPGVGKGDVVPAMLTPGEGIVPGGVMDGLRNVARNGGFNNGQRHTTVHVSPTYHVNTIDGDGMRDVLDKHTDQLQAHFDSAVRRTNR